MREMPSNDSFALGITDRYIVYLKVYTDPINENSSTNLYYAGSGRSDWMKLFKQPVRSQAAKRKFTTNFSL